MGPKEESQPFGVKAENPHPSHKAQLLTNSRFSRPAAPLPAHHRNHELPTGQAPAQAIPFPSTESCTGFIFRVGLPFSLPLTPPICYQQPAEGGGFAPASPLPTCSPLGGAAAHNEFPKAFCVPQRAGARSQHAVCLCKGPIMFQHIALLGAHLPTCSGAVQAEGRRGCAHRANTALLCPSVSCSSRLRPVEY